MGGNYERKKEREKKKKILDDTVYRRYYWSDFNYSFLSNITYTIRVGSKEKETFNECIIMLDTETSKRNNSRIEENHVVMFTITIGSYEKNLVTLWGRKPSECVECINRIINKLDGEKTVFYVHNLSYDWVFLRKFLIQKFAEPKKQLNTKSHYPIYIEFSNGMILRDSLILAQRSLEKWAIDLDVEHKKAVGKWDYDTIRNQEHIYTENELTYAEFDTVCGCDCIRAIMKMLNKHIYSMPWTATGIPREEVRKQGTSNKMRNLFNKIAPSYDLYIQLVQTYHGGYTHANRYYVNRLVKDDIKAFDFTSSYPYCMIAFKYPMEKFSRLEVDCNIDDILNTASDYAYTFKLEMLDICIKDMHTPMPYLQASKCIQIDKDAIIDNGRILKAKYVAIYITEVDLSIILNQYEKTFYKLSDVYCAKKDYLPKWFTDYIYQLFKDKTMEKGGDPVNYAILKAKLNSLYGMLAQRSVKEEIVEDYATGEFKKQKQIDPEELYDKYLRNRRNILPYQWGVWVTAYACRNLFILGSMCDIWLYSDTDSCYGIGWKLEQVKGYNKMCENLLCDRGYKPIKNNNITYILGTAELDGEYCEFKTMGAKRYAVRKSDNSLKITVAGVPKKGVASLNNDLNNFKVGTIFKGEVSGKKQHTYFYADKIHVDEHGNEIGDSIDLSPCDYLLDQTEILFTDEVFYNEITMNNIERGVYNE